MFEVRNIVFGDGKPAVAVPITGKTEAEICSEAAGARGEADLIELRADAFEGIHDTMRLLALLVDVRGAFDGPILFTLRSAREGGRLNVDPEEYLDILRIAISELLYIKEAPMKVVVDEALELAKKYSTDDSASFVNGILAKVIVDNGIK